MADWNKHGAIAGYGAWAWTAATIGVMVWLGLRNSAPTRLEGAAAGAPVIPTWAFWVAPLIYVIGLVVAALFHLKARSTASSPKRPITLTDEERLARERLFEFFRLCGPDLYRDASEFGNSIRTRLGNQDDWRGCIGGLFSTFAERGFVAKYTSLSGLIPLHGSYSGSLTDLQRQFYDFYDAYYWWAHWAQKVAQLIPVDFCNDSAYAEWDKSDEQFLRRFKETTVVAGLGWLNTQIRGGQKPFRIRDPKRLA